MKIYRAVDILPFLKTVSSAKMKRRKSEDIEVILKTMFKGKPLFPGSWLHRREILAIRKENKDISKKQNK